MATQKLSRFQEAKLAFEHYFEENDFFVPEVYYFRDEETGAERTYTLTWIQRFFLTLHEPSSSIMSSICSNTIMAVILLNIIVNVMMTLPQYRGYPVDDCSSPACENVSGVCANETICEPTTEPLLVSIDDACVIIFTIEYVFRIAMVGQASLRLAGLVPAGWDEEEHFLAQHEDRDPELEPETTALQTTQAYFWQAKNLIDLVAILPFYVTLANPDSDTSLSFIRVLRLFRVVRAFKMNASSGVTNLIIKTVQESMQVIILLLFFSAMIILIFGSIIFDVEMGTYVYNSEYPSGAYIHKDSETGDDYKSPYTSTLVGMYWAVITMTTVGYGDIVPVTTEGRLIAVACAFIGVLFMALPISILGANFTVQYQRLSAQQRAERKKRNNLMLQKKAASISGKAITEGVDDSNSSKVNRASSFSDEVDSSNLRTGNRLADAIMIEQRKDDAEREKMFANKYGTVSITDQDNDAADDASDKSYLDSPRRAERIDSSDNNNISKILLTIDEMEEKVNDVVIPSEKCRKSLKALIATAKSICGEATRQRREDIASANERCRSVVYSCDRLLTGVQEVIHEIDENQSRML
jgi:voltage-gated potassium channel Kch